ncbi:hypothetical protein DENSPDRAFT_808294 [Dentipellis sp. KUC8613]|nr:hypothetical protein DENSPDRAFT_808294 [Dentipellis sp. KUC8613]
MSTPDSELPSYTRIPSSADTRGPASTLSTQHRIRLESRDSKTRPWLTLLLRSRAPDAKGLPLYFDRDVIKGKVMVDLEKPETVKGIAVTLRAGITAVGQEEDVFLEETHTLWSAADGNASKLTGKHEWPFKIALPADTLASQNPKLPRERWALPPSFSERASPTYIDYRLVVTVRRGVLRVNNTLTTSFGYRPRSAAQPPSVLRLLAYQERSPLLGPDADPEGWKSFPVTIQGTLFNTRPVTVSSTLAIATPFTYALNSPIPLHLTLRSTDTQALDLLSSPGAPLVQLTRTVALGSDATDERAARRSNNTFTAAVGRAVFWPEEQQPAGGMERRLRGELHVRQGTKPSFAFPRFVVKYDLTLLAPRVSGFAVQNARPGDALMSQRVTITLSNAPGIIPVSRAPPGYGDEAEGDYNVATGFLENGDQRFLSHRLG